MELPEEHAGNGLYGPHVCDVKLYKLTPNGGTVAPVHGTVTLNVDGRVGFTGTVMLYTGEYVGVIFA